MKIEIELKIGLTEALASMLSGALNGSRPFTPAASTATETVQLAAGEPVSSGSATDAQTASPGPAASTRRASSRTRAAGSPADPTAAASGAAATSTSAAQASTPQAAGAGSVFDGGAAPAGNAAAPSGDVFGQQIKNANAAAAIEEAQQVSRQLANDVPAFSAKDLGDAASRVLPIIGPRGLKNMLKDFQNAAGEPVTKLQDLQPADYGEVIEALALVQPAA